MKIIKRDGSQQDFQPNKIVERIKKQCYNLKCDYDKLAIEVISNVTDNITTREIDDITIKLAAYKVSLHPDYSYLASRIVISRLHKEYPKTLAVSNLHDKVKTNYNKWKLYIDSYIDYRRDYNFDYFGIDTLLKSYLLPNELPQQMYARVALFLADTQEEWRRYYEVLSNQEVSVATPILMNAGTKNSTLISCCLIDNFEDSLEGINTTFQKASKASADTAGIGINITNLRSKDSCIGTTNSKACGITKYAKLAEAYAKAFTQRKRAGSYALYLDIWHKDIVDFLSLTLQTGDYRERTRDIFTAVNVRDNFMEALINKEDYHLFCPNDFRKEYGFDINTTHGEEFTKWYNKAITTIPTVKVKAEDLWHKVLDSQLESGTPYIHYIDNSNRNVPYKETIRQSNLCIEVMIPTNDREIAQCCLGSITLKNNNINTLTNSMKVLVEMLNKVIDLNMYNNKEAEYSGKLRRSIGIGIQGFADMCNRQGIGLDTPECKELTDNIFSLLYNVGWETSVNLNKKYNYDLSEQFKDTHPYKNACNTTILALMPTTGTSIVTGNSESFEPYTGNLIKRTTMHGEYIVWNNNLVSYLESVSLWTPDIRRQLIESGNGSVMNIDFGEHTEYIRKVFKTVFEYKQKDLIDLAVIRQKYLSMSQSLNLYFPSTNNSKSTRSSALIYAWKQGLNTGVYYTRTNHATKGFTYTVQNETDNSQFTCEGGCEG